VNVEGPALRAVIELNPSALAQAASLDLERSSKGKRGPLHGIPVLLKVPSSFTLTFFHSAQAFTRIILLQLLQKVSIPNLYWQVLTHGHRNEHHCGLIWSFQIHCSGRCCSCQKYDGIFHCKKVLDKLTLYFGYSVVCVAILYSKGQIF